MNSSCTEPSLLQSKAKQKTRPRPEEEEEQECTRTPVYQEQGSWDSPLDP